MSKEGFEVASRVEVTEGAPKLTVHNLEDGVIIVGGKAGIWKQVPVGIRNSELCFGFKNLAAALSRTSDVAVLVVEMGGPTSAYFVRRHFVFDSSEELDLSKALTSPKALKLWDCSACKCENAGRIKDSRNVLNDYETGN